MIFKKKCVSKTHYLQNNLNGVGVAFAFLKAPKL